jgi:CDP-diacylglycerol--glycerol-3-phosphate 3-phosphatidyltransferase
MTGRIWTLSNGLSLLRMLLVIPVTILLLSESPGSRALAAVLIAVGALTDYLDGMAARRRNEITPLGKIIDPVADKIGIGAVAIVLTVQGTLPAWFTLALVGRDLGIMAAASLLSNRGEGVPQSNPVGKWTAAVLAVIVFAGVLDPRDSAGALGPAIIAGTLMIALSSLSYAARLRRTLRGSAGHPAPRPER